MTTVIMLPLPYTWLPLFDVGNIVQGSAKKVVPRLRECCGQSQADVVSKSSNNIHQTWGPPFSRSLYSTQRRQGIRSGQTQVYSRGRNLPEKPRLLSFFKATKFWTLQLTVSFDKTFKCFYQAYQACFLQTHSEQQLNSVPRKLTLHNKNSHGGEWTLEFEGREGQLSGNLVDRFDLQDNSQTHRQIFGRRGQTTLAWENVFLLKQGAMFFDMGRPHKYLDHSLPHVM